MKSQLVIGLGEVGQALQKILSCEGFDPIKNILPMLVTYDVLHICFPYSQTFKESVIKYKEQFKSDLIIIHSTVPIGTSFSLSAVHSPIRGVHPDLERGIRTFGKFVGGERAEEAAQIFRANRINCLVTKKSENTEAMKLWDTLQYGMAILQEKEIHDFCQQNNLDFDVVYTKANISYNEGYSLLGKSQYAKYILRHSDGKIGGHCVVNNAKLLETESAKRLLEINNKL